VSVGGPGHEVVVVEVENFVGSKTMRDLTVADVHTYHVLAGNTPVLAHNCGGSGPARGVLEVSDRYSSTAAVRNFNPSGAREFVFDPINNRFATGNSHGLRHFGLARALGANEDTVVGGMLTRGPNREFFTDEVSGHYGLNWTPEVREQFVRFMRGFDFDVQHTAWPGRAP
jgi:hypothetical protein